MALTAAVTRKLDNNFVQVEVKNKVGGTRYYRVPEDKADSFSKEYVHNSKRMYRLSSVLTFTSILGALSLGLFFTRNAASKGLKYAVSGVMGLAAGAVSTASGQKTSTKNHTEFLKNYNAEEIRYDNKEFPA